MGTLKTSASAVPGGLNTGLQEEPYGTLSRNNLWKDLQDKVGAVLEKYFEGQEWFVVETKWSQDRRKLEVFVDGDRGVNIEVCTGLNRQLGALLDEHPWDQPVLLEVGSPGADAPLKLPRQYAQHVGRELCVRTMPEGEVVGQLAEVHEDAIVLVRAQELVSIPFSHIIFARVVLKF
jgi:ribosome maturation factor RimP